MDDLYKKERNDIYESDDKGDEDNTAQQNSCHFVSTSLTQLFS
jgi:hypothetical protein